MDPEGFVVLVAMEIHLDNLPTYAGGLGLLAGDLLFSAADLNYPMVGVTLLHDKGYVWHDVSQGKVIDHEEPYNPLEHCEKLDLKLRLELKTTPIHLSVWRYNVKGIRREVPVYLLDANVPENPPQLRSLTSRVYIESSWGERLLKELILGLGALQLVEKLRLPVSKFHLNESHAGFLAVELIKRSGNLMDVKRKVVFTTHTPLPHGHEEFEYNLVEKHYEVPQVVKEVSPGKLKMTRLLEAVSGYYNCVSHKFSLVHRLIFPGSDPEYITNGVHHVRWVYSRVADFYDERLPGWREEPGKLTYVVAQPLEKVLAVKRACKTALVEYVNSWAYSNGTFQARAFTVAARRRITGYKRLTLILQDLELLEELAKKHGLQLVFSGTVHPADGSGRGELSKILDLASTLKHVKIAFIGKRGVNLEKLVAAGSDLWLHTPRPPFEACGTSWMRAALNLTPTLASRDGGVLEAIVDGHNGWLFGRNVMLPNEPLDDKEEAGDMYAKLKEAIELYYSNPKAYALICARSTATIAPYFNSHRALLEYVARAYVQP
ncbi:MAG: alpha-glucan family phosphorylase [Thermofilaceae archaeon]|nr:alpha-glucan family phosphorylase [Thermofilaceae archaeon]